jgi:phage tail P2-like protein
MSDHLLPANASSQERALSLAIERAGSVPVPVRDAWNPDTCPPQLLGWLAWALSVDEWDGSWTDDQKRAVIKRSVAVHRYKGTIGAVREAIAALGLQAQVQEWFNQIPQAAPYTFRLLLTANQVGATQRQQQVLLQVLDRTKNLRSHLTEVQVIATTQAGPCVAACAAVGSDIAISGYVGPELVANETTLCF